MDKEKKTEISEKPSDFIRKMRIFYKRNIKKLSDRFNFEAGVDVLDDVQVLYKRNKVNRNILLITNVVLILFTFIGNQDPNALVIIIFGIIMFCSKNLQRRFVWMKRSSLTVWPARIWLVSWIFSWVC